MQGLGLLYTLLPVLRRSDARVAALERHDAFFNMNASMAPVVIGILWRLESERRGEAAVRMRDALSAPLSGVGDRFVWSALRPACLAAALAGLGLASAWGLAPAFGVYGLWLAWVWRRGFVLGANAGDALPEHLDALGPPGTRSLQAAAVFLAGWLLGQGIVSTALGSAAAALGMGVVVGVGYYASRRQIAPGTVFLLLIALYSLARRVHLEDPVGPP